MKPIVVFDVESVGLHGVGFAVGAVVLDLETGERVEEFYAAFDPQRDEHWHVSEDRRNWPWVEENVLPTLPVPPFTHFASHECYSAFWRFWRKWAEQGALMAADCAWPVEASFLSECASYEWNRREWEGPYPLLDLSSVLFAYGLNPIGTFDRLPDELPAHNPLNDARQSARVLYETMRRK